MQAQSATAEMAASSGGLRLWVLVAHEGDYEGRVEQGVLASLPIRCIIVAFVALQWYGWSMVAGKLTGFVSDAVQERDLIARPLVQRRVGTVQKLLAGEPVEEAELDWLGYQLHACWHLGVIAIGDDADDVLSRLRTGLERKLLQVPSDDGVIWGWLGGRLKLAVRELERLLSVNADANCCLVVGGPGRGLDGWRQTHREARDALLAALRGPEKLVRYADYPLFTAAVQNDTLMRWLIDFLAPLRSQRDGGVRLLQTLRALINTECNRRAAAAMLGVDRHTVENRLRTAEELLGRSLTTCLPELDTALRLAELDGASVTATGNLPTLLIAQLHQGFPSAPTSRT